MEDILSLVTSAKIADCTREEVLRSFGVRNFDICFVCIGTNFQSSLEITSQLKELGAPYVISKATRDIQAKFLLRNGADEVVYPDRDIAKRLAIKVSANHVYDYMEMGDYSIYEIQPLEEWVGKSIKLTSERISSKFSSFSSTAITSLPFSTRSMHKCLPNLPIPITNIDFISLSLLTNRDLFFINLILAAVCTLIMAGLETLPLSDILMEIFSAIGTVGISTRITRHIKYKEGSPSWW